MAGATRVVRIDVTRNLYEEIEEAAMDNDENVGAWVVWAIQQKLEDRRTDERS